MAGLAKIAIEKLDNLGYLEVQNLHPQQKNMAKQKNQKVKVKIKKDPEFERIPLLIIYKQNGEICVEQPEEVINPFEILGFLKVFVKLREEILMEDMLDRSLEGWEECP